ncbi:MAG: fatty acid desaturase [Bacteroidetes bacterium]|nr:fatty acid desaturase [Bacteroidota bacterium]
MEQTIFETIKKSTIVNSKGEKYNEFKSKLKPRFGLVWFHITLGYIALITVLIAAGYMQNKYSTYFWFTIPVAALLIGYIIAYIHLFIHEAAHYNIASDRKTNDKLANAFIGLIVGMDIGFYRVIHFDHHRFLGTTHDTEKTYFDGLNWRFLIESLTGIRVIKVMTNRDDKMKNNTNIDPKLLAANKKMFLGGAFLNFCIVVALFATGNWQIALVWLIGMGVMFPFFAALRQLLEHRSENASAAIDYNTVDHGITNRMFGNGLIATTMGAAGFNRHLLHHWDPQVSYTRLKDVERFLMDTELAPPMDKTRTNYIKTFFKLFNK